MYINKKTTTEIYKQHQLTLDIFLNVVDFLNLGDFESAAESVEALDYHLDILTGQLEDNLLSDKHFKEAYNIKDK